MVSKKRNNLLKKLNKKTGNVWETGGSLVSSGEIIYSKEEGLEVEGKKIPLRALRSVTIDDEGYGSIFVDPEYNLAAGGRR